MFDALKAKIKDALPTTSSIKLTAAITAGCAALLVVQSVATAAMSDLGHEILDLV